MMNNEINQNTNQESNPLLQRNLNVDKKPINFKRVIAIVLVVFLVGAFIITNFYLKEDKVDIINTDIENKAKSNPIENIYRPPVNNTEKSVNVTESEDNKTTNTTDVDEDETGANEEIKIVYGIAVKDFNVYDRAESSTEEEYKIEVKKDSVVLTINFIDDDSGYVKTFSTPGVKKAVSSCDCGSSCDIYYINDKNELRESSLDSDDKESNKLIKTNVKDIETKFVANDFSTCSYDSVIITNSDNTRSVLNEVHKLYSYDESNRMFISLGYDEKENDASEEIVLYVANVSAKIDTFFKDDKGNMIYAKAVVDIENNKEVYVIDENNYIYYYSNFSNNQKGVLYKNTKVKTFNKINAKTGKDSLDVTYEDGSTESLNGYIFVK